MSEPDDSEALAAENRRDALAALAALLLPLIGGTYTARDTVPAIADAILAAGWRPPAPLPLNAAVVSGYDEWLAANPDWQSKPAHSSSDPHAEQAYNAAHRLPPAVDDGRIIDSFGNEHHHTWACRLCGTPREDDQ